MRVNGKERTKAIMRKEMTLKIPSSLILSILRLLILVNIILLLLLLQLSCSSIIKYKFSIKIPSLSALMQYGDIEEQKKMFFFLFCIVILLLLMLLLKMIMFMKVPLHARYTHTLTPYINK